jgi:hypothetical protein
VWVPGGAGADNSRQGVLPGDAGILPGERLEEGEYHYVVRLDGSLRAMNNEQMWALDSSAGHTSLADRKPILMAGTFDVDAAGNVIRFDNYSGHYRPNETAGYESLESIARNAFDRHGLPAPRPGAWDPHTFGRR